MDWLESVFGTIGTKAGEALDFHLDDWFGLPSKTQSYSPVAGLGGNPYPEQTAPINPAPTEQGFMIGNNTTTYALGFGALLLGFLVYKAVK